MAVHSPSAVVLLLALSACGDVDAEQRAAVVGTWELRWPVLLETLREMHDSDPAKQARWADRLDRAEKKGWPDQDLRLDADGTLELIDRTPDPSARRGTWTVERVAGTLAPWTVTIVVSQPASIPPTYTATKYWNGRFLFSVLDVDGAMGHDDSIPVMLVRKAP